MKLENESMFFHSTHSHKAVAKESELNNDAMDSERLRIESEENHVNGDKNLDDHLQYRTKDKYGWNPFKDDFSSMDSSDNDDVKVFNVESFEKNVQKYDQPELIVCENSCNFVKDICIDDGMIACSVPDISMSEKGSINQEDFDGLIPVMVLECEVKDLNTKDSLELKPGNDNGNDDEQVSSEIDPSVSGCEELENDAEKSTSKDPARFSRSEEPKDNDIVNDLSSDSRLEKGKFSINFSPLEPDSNDKIECRENGEDQGDIRKSEFGELSNIEDRMSGRIQLGIGESSFSSTSPSASLLNYSGPVAYSGSLSIRSDSSTTSARSFAFPILQTEWHHNSPIRMAKADRRLFGKRKGWRHGLFCCSF